jgi:hypothetical protein
LLNKN